MLKTNGTELIDESADVCLHFSGHVTSPVFLRDFVFVGMRAAHTSFSPFTLYQAIYACKCFQINV